MALYYYGEIIAFRIGVYKLLTSTWTICNWLVVVGLSSIFARWHVAISRYCWNNWSRAMIAEPGRFLKNKVQKVEVVSEKDYRWFGNVAGCLKQLGCLAMFNRHTVARLFWCLDIIVLYFLYTCFITVVMIQKIQNGQKKNAFRSWILISPVVTLYASVQCTETVLVCDWVLDYSVST